MGRTGRPHYSLLTTPSAIPHDRHRATCSMGLRRPRAQLGPWAGRGPRRSCTERYNAAPSAVGPTGTAGHGRAVESSRLRMPTLAPPAAGPARESWAAGGPEELRDSEWACGPFAVTSDRLLSVLHPQVTVIGDSTIFFCIGLLHSELGVEIQIYPFELGSVGIKADGEETRQSSYNSNCV